MLVEKMMGCVILISMYLLAIPIANGISNIIGEDTLESNISNYTSNSNIVRSLANNVSRAIGMDAFIENLNDGL